MKKSAFLLLACVLTLVSLGLLMVFNTTSAEVIDRNLNISTHHALFKQLLYLCVSSVGALLVWFYGKRKILIWSGYFFYVNVVLLILVFIPGIGEQINGAHRWIKLGTLSFQPSEFLKLTMPLYFIALLFKKNEMSWKRFYKIIILFSIPLGLVLMEPDNGTTIITVLTMIALFFICKIRLIYWLIPILTFSTVAGVVGFQMSHVKKRIQIYLHPELDLLGKGHQPYQAKIAAGSGELFGKGIGQSLQKLNYLPEARSDYIAAIYAEEFGFMGILFLVLLYLLMGCTGFHIASQAEEKHGFYIATILTFLVVLQAFLNLGVVSGLLPSKGINLPFFSQGGSSLLANTIVVTLIMTVARKGHKVDLKHTGWKHIQEV